MVEAKTTGGGVVRFERGSEAASEVGSGCGQQAAGGATNIKTSIILLSTSTNQNRILI